jgi:hypothetical protein
LSLELRPIGVREASAVVKRLHRHLPRVIGGLFAAAVYERGELVGVGVASQPKARLSRDGFTVEITRIATSGSRNACSRLYGALLRASAAVGYRRAITFTRLDEPGSSLRAAGWIEDGTTREQSWDRPSRGRFADTSQVRRLVRRLV